MTNLKIKTSKHLRFVISFFVCFLFLVTCIFPMAQPTWAHVESHDRKIGAILHIDPDDDPIVGQPATFYFEFKDQNNKFQPAKCNCVFLVSENGNVLYTNSLTAGNSNPTLDNLSQSFTFPQKDVYQVQVKGTPLTPNDFQSFTLNYDVRVAKDSGSAQVPAVVMPGMTDEQSASIPNWFQTHAVFLVGISIIVLFLFGTFIRRQLAIKRNKSSNPPPLYQKPQTPVPPPNS
jgi:hypothetical protein